MIKMLRVISIFFFVVVSSSGIAQNYRIDSLNLALAGKPNDLKILWELAYEFVSVDNKIAFKYAEMTHAVAIKARDSLYIVKSERMMGQLYRFMDKLDESIRFLNSSLAIAQRNDFVKEVANISNALANSYSLLFEFDKALEFNLKALVLHEAERDPKKINQTLMNIGFVYYRMGSSLEAIDYFERSLNLKLRYGDRVDLDILYSNLGFCHSDRKNVKEARIFFNKAFETCIPNCSNSIITQVEMGLAKNFVIEKNYEQAEIHYLKSLRHSEVSNDQRFQIEIANELIELYLLKNDLIRTANYFKYVESLPEFIQYSSFNVDFYRLKAKYYTKLKNFELANSFQKKYSDAIELERGNERSLSLVKVKAQFIERENIIRINEQKKQLALQEQALAQHRILNLLIGAAGILTITVILILIKANRKKQCISELLNQRVKERTEELERNRDELEQTHNEQISILKRVSSDLVASLSTIQELSDIAYAELPAHDAVFFKKAESMTKKMVDYMRSYSK